MRAVGLPVRIAGTYEAQPRGKKLPRPVPVRIHLGTPLFVEAKASEGGTQAAERIAQELRDAVERAGG